MDYSTCSFEQDIDGTLFNKFMIHFRYLSSSRPSNIMIGYSTSIDYIENWNRPIGFGMNKSCSVCIWLNGKTCITWGHNINNYGSLSYRPQTNFQSGDIFTLSFDFVNDCVEFYHNDNKAPGIISFNGAKCIIPAISLIDKGDSIQVIKWEYEFQKMR